MCLAGHEQWLPRVTTIPAICSCIPKWEWTTSVQCSRFVLIISNHLQCWLELVKITGEIRNAMMVPGTTSSQVLFLLCPTGVFSCLRLKPLSAAKLLKRFQTSRWLYIEHWLTNVPTQKRLTPAFCQNSSRGHFYRLQKKVRLKMASTRRTASLPRRFSISLGSSKYPQGLNQV